MASELVRKCNDAMHLGFDFSAIWHSIIKDDAAVAGVPVQRHDGAHTYLEIPLVKGDWLVFDLETKKVSRR
jgi:hypothetical protein